MLHTIFLKDLSAHKISCFCINGASVASKLEVRNPPC